MPEHQPDNGEERTPLPEPEEEEDERYVAFPGGIPKRWFNPAFYLFLTILVTYAVVAIIGEFQEGAKLKSSLVVIARHIWMHLADFCFTLVVTIVVICKGLERVMYYLDAKRQAARDRRRAERAERLIEEYKQEQQRAEHERQRAEQLAEQERQRAEQEQQRAEQQQQRAEQEQQIAEQERQRAEQEQQRAEQAEAEKERILQELQKYREDEE